MASYNKIQLAGKLNDNPDVKVTTSGHSLSKFTLIVPRLESLPNKRFDYIRVIAWRENADKTTHYKKDDILYIEGRILTNSYEDESTGQRKWTTEIEAKQVISLGEAFDLNNASFNSSAQNDEPFNNSFDNTEDVSSTNEIENIPKIPVKEDVFFNDAPAEKTDNSTTEASINEAPNIEESFPENTPPVNEIENELEEDVPF